MVGSDGRGREAESAKSRVPLAGPVHRTNTFVGGRTDLEDFRISRGDKPLRERKRPPTPRECSTRRGETGCDIVPVVEMRAMPNPKIADVVVELFWTEFRAVADSESSVGVDGAFLMPHGSAVCESFDDVEASSCA